MSYHRVLEALSRKSLFITACVVLAWPGNSVAAAVPGFNIQGRLTDANGVNRDGVFSLKFGIFDAASGGTVRWEKALPSVTVRNGNFQVVLQDPPGAGTAPSLADAAAVSEPYLEIQVGSETPLVPRQKLASVPSALMVHGGAGGNVFKASGSVGVGTTSPGEKFTVGDNKFQVNSAGNLVKINNVSYAWPPSQGASQAVLTNDGSGNLNWTSAGALAPRALAYTAFPQKSIDATTLGTCVPGSIVTLTLAGSSKVEMVFSGALYLAQDGGGNRAYVSALVDGAPPEGISGPILVGMIYPDGHQVVFPASFSFVTRSSLSPGDHQFCVSAAKLQAGNVAYLCSDISCRVEVREWR